MSIIVGYIPTREGHAALQKAREEALLRRANLVLVNSTRSGRDFDAGETERFEGQLRQVRESLQGSGIEVEVRTMDTGNEPAEDLVTVAEETEADCIIIGLRRRSPIGKLILGSNAQRILLEAQCPVLAVKATENRSAG